MSNLRARGERYKHLLGLESRSLMTLEKAVMMAEWKKKWTTANVSLMTAIHDYQVQSLFLLGQVLHKLWSSCILRFPYMPKSYSMCLSSEKFFSNQSIIQLLVFQLSDLKKKGHQLLHQIIIYLKQERGLPLWLSW